jgi:hypothetical protein
VLRKLIQLLFILACWGGLAMIGIETWLSPTTFTTENRRLTPKPDPPPRVMEAGNYIHQLESWWSDAMHYRQFLVRLSTRLHMALGINPQSEVIVGKNGWLFWSGEHSEEAFRNNRPLTPGEVGAWRSYLLYRQHQAKKHHAKYVFIVIPNKESVYPEFMPDNYTSLSNQTWLDQIINAVRNDNIDIVDLREPLMEAKKHTLIYVPEDTHWNLVGANYAQYAILQHLSKDFPKLNPVFYPLESFHETNSPDFTKLGIESYEGLVYMLGIDTNSTQPLFKESIAKCTTPAAIPLPSYWESMEEHQKEHTFRATSCDTASYRVAMYRDSFADSLAPYFSESFRYIAYLWTPRPNDMPTWDYFLDHLKPDIILDELIGRHLLKIPRRGIDYPDVPAQGTLPTFDNYKKSLASSLAKGDQNAANLLASIESAEKGNKDAQFWLGAALRDGTIFQQDYDQAFTYFEAAAKQGSQPAEYFLGVMYEHGESVTEDFAKAEYWYTQSANGENAEWANRGKLGLKFLQDKMKPDDVILTR